MKVRFLSIPSLLCAALAAQQTATVDATVKTIDTANRASPPPVAPVSESVALSKTAPNGATAPAGIVEPWFGQLATGSRKTTFVVGKSKADAAQPDVLLVDGTRVDLKVTALQARGNAPSPGVRSEPADISVMGSGGTVAGKATFFKMGETDPTLNLSFPSYLEGRVKLGDAEVTVAVVDKNLDGKFDSVEDLWAIANGKTTVNAYGMSALGERRFENGQLISLKVDKSKLTLTTVAATGPDPKDAAAHRVRVEHIWFERFDKEREGFVKAQEMNTARPKAKDPVHWNYVSFDEAIALGKKANKPVFIDVMAFWCVWCYRMDYYTYPDQEVADLLNTKFVPVKLIQEQAKAGEYEMLMKEKLKATGIPAMGVFDPEGNLVHQIGGWKKPEDSKGKPDAAKPAAAKADAPPAVNKGFVSELKDALAGKASDASAPKGGEAKKPGGEKK